MQFRFSFRDVQLASWKINFMKTICASIFLNRVIVKPAGVWIESKLNV